MSNGGDFVMFLGIGKLEFLGVWVVFCMIWVVLFFNLKIL